MGLFNLDNLDDPQKQMLLQIGLGLLGGSGNTNKNFGADLASAGQKGLLAYGSARKQQRDDRSNELSQLSATYKILKEQDQQARLNAMVTGEQYVPNPIMQQHEKRLGDLMGQPSLFQGQGAAPSPAAPAQIGMHPAMASQYSPAVRPELRQQGPMPQPQARPSLQDQLRAANISPEVAQGLIASGKSEELFKMLGKAMVPQNGPAGVTRLNQQTGLPEVVAGSATPGQVQFVRDPKTGQLVAQPIQGAAEQVAQLEAAKTTAIEGAKAPYSFTNTQTGPGGGANWMSTAAMVAREQAQRGQIPPPGPSQQGPRVGSLEVTQPSRMYGGGGLTGPNPIQVSADKTQGDALAKFHADTFIETQVAGKAAVKGLQQADRMEQLLNDVDTGKLTPVGMEVSGYLRSIGVPVDAKLGNKQAAEALASNIALENRNPSGGAGMPGAMSDGDRKFLQNMGPNLAQTPEGRKLIVETKRKILQRDQEVAQLARDYRKRNNGKIDDGFLQELQDFSNKNPLFPQNDGPRQVAPGVTVERIR